MFDKLVQIMGGNLLGGVKDLIQTFKLPPEQQIQFEATVAKLEADTKQALAKIDADDRASARAREIATKDRTPAYLAYISIGGFFSVLAIQFYFAWNNHLINEGVQRTLDISTGVLFAMVLAVKDYFFGSSKGSDDKTKLLMDGHSK